MHIDYFSDHEHAYIHVYSYIHTYTLGWVSFTAEAGPLGVRFLITSVHTYMYMHIFIHTYIYTHLAGCP